VGRARALVWLGIDVGGPRKGFDAAVVDEQRLVWHDRRLRVADVVEAVARFAPAEVAIDSPCRCAPDGERSRASERELVGAKVCGIRWTPDRQRVAVGDYYGWVREGLALYDALRDRGVEPIEVFPTASWTRWHEARGKRRRSTWSRAALAGLGLEDVPERTSQDLRDAIAAALTARDHTRRRTQTFGGEIVVPRQRR
jgi:predicted nuclease with RNAse H fold